MSEYIDVQNKINVTNIIIVFLFIIVCTINGMSDFPIYKQDVAKTIFPDPVSYTQVTELNTNLLESGVVLNNVGTTFNFIVLAMFILAALMMVGLVGGVLGKSGGMV